MTSESMRSVQASQLTIKASAIRESDVGTHTERVGNSEAIHQLLAIRSCFRDSTAETSAHFPLYLLFLTTSRRLSSCHERSPSTSSTVRYSTVQYFH
jgi:hypothetical protein